MLSNNDSYYSICNHIFFRALNIDHMSHTKTRAIIQYIIFYIKQYYVEFILIAQHLIFLTEHELELQTLCNSIRIFLRLIQMEICNHKSYCL